jgi:hypothetical protein
MHSFGVFEHIIFKDRLPPADEAKHLSEQQQTYFGPDPDAKAEIANHRYLSAEKLFRGGGAQKVYKMLAREHLESFLRTGRIRLGTVAHYQKAELVERSDAKEGLFILLGNGAERSVSNVVSLGSHVLAYCTTLDYRVHFPDCDACLQIRNVGGFMNAITRSLNRLFAPAGNVVARVTSEACRYHHSRVIVGPIAAGALETPPRIDVTTVDLLGDAKYFLKPVKNQREREFRMVWVMRKDVESPVFIECPEAVNFCREFRP